MIDFNYLRILKGYERLTSKGRDYFETVLKNPPARPVGETSLFSISGAYATAKFPHMKEYDSGGCEKPYVLMSIMDPSIVDIISQPYALSIVRHDILGRRRPGPYVCDYIECTNESFCLVENKPLAKIRKLAGETKDWHQDEGGFWRFGPCDEVAKDLGMRSKVFCPDLYPSAYLVNLQFLCRIPSSDLVAEQPLLVGRVKKALHERPHSILELCNRIDGLTGAYLYQAMVKGYIFGLIERQHFNLDFVLFATELEARHQELHIRSLALPDQAALGPMHQRLQICSPTELALTHAAQSRYDDRRKSGKVKDATDYRDEGMLRKAKLEGAPRLAAFVRRVGERGGKGQPLAESQREPIVAHAKAYFAKNRTPKFSKLRGDFVAQAEDEGHFVPSLETHRRIFNQTFSPERAAFMTGGKRAFHRARPMVDGLVANPRLAIAGLHVHIDGVYGDVRSAPDEDARYLRPIFYPLIDDVNGKVFSMGIKIGAGSTMAVLMAHRDCYVRHKFLPSQIYFDFGSEFYNRCIPEMHAHFLVSYERRPAGAARFGGLGESFNAQFSAYLQTLAGGTYFDKAGRSADGNRKSRATAELDIPAIIRAALRWVFEIWNNSPIGGSSLSPNERFEEHYRCFPEAFVAVENSLLSAYHTSLPLKARVFDYVRGSRFGGDKYGSETIAGLLVRDERPTKPRLDCLDPSQIHVMTRGGPETLRSQDFKRVEGLDLALRMEKQSSLFSYSSTAKFNQQTRNAKEARERRDAEKIAAALRDAAGDSQSPNEAEKLDQETFESFSASLSKPLKKLERLE